MKSVKVHAVAHNCCAPEVEHLKLELYQKDIGIQFTRISEASVLLVAGFLNPKLSEHIVNTYSQMKHPRRVIAIGACAASGALFLNETRKLEDILPVDVYVPGCAPSPSMIAKAIEMCVSEEVQVAREN